MRNMYTMVVMPNRLQAAGETLKQDRLGGPLVEVPLNAWEFLSDQGPRAVLSPNAPVDIQKRRHMLHATFAGVGDTVDSLNQGKVVRAAGDAVFGAFGGLGKDATDALTGKDTKIIRNYDIAA